MSHRRERFILVTLRGCGGNLTLGNIAKSQGTKNALQKTYHLKTMHDERVALFFGPSRSAGVKPEVGISIASVLPLAFFNIHGFV